MRAAESALSTSRTPRERSTSLVELGDVFFLNGDLQSAFDRYREALAIDASLANAGLANDADTSRDLGISLQRMGDLALALGNAQLAYSYFLADFRRDAALAAADPTNPRTLDGCNDVIKLHDAIVASGQLDASRNLIEAAIPACQELVDHGVADAVLPTAYLRWRHANILAVQGNLRAARQELEPLRTVANQRLSADPTNVALALQAQLLAISFADLDMLAGHQGRARDSLDRIISALQSYVSTGSLAPTATAYIWRARVRLASIPGSGINWESLESEWPATRIQGDLAALDWHFIAAAQSDRMKTAP
jgi:tetratricopeptide (TPR) repeat protein